MSELRVHAERPIGAPAEVVYRCLADYREHHHRFLPPQFSGYRVEEGGVGEGTVISFTTTLGGRARAFRCRVTEPEPGRRLVEADTLSALTTTSTVIPEGTGSRVRLETVWESAGGVTGLLERLVAPVLMRRLYADELDRLDRYTRELARP